MGGITAALGATLVLAGLGMQPAAAATQAEAAFYTGTNQTGTEIPVDVNAIGVCHNLSQPALSAANFVAEDIDVFFNPGCVTGAPGQQGGSYYVVGSLHTANFPYPAVSYRVRPIS